MGPSRDVPSWSDASLTVWGKTDIFTGQWLPLVKHLEDAALTMRLLWRDQPPSVRNLFIDHFGDVEQTETFLTFVAAVHDVGKASSFLLKAGPSLGDVPLPDFRSLMAKADVHIDHRADSTVRHGAVGQVTLDHWLQDHHGWIRKRATKLSGIVGGHHGTPPTRLDVRQLRNTPQRWDSPSLQRVRKEILDQMAIFTGADRWMREWGERDLPITLQMLAEGLLIQADWISSNTELFPLTFDPDPIARADEAWAELALPKPWQPTHTSASPTELFRNRFPSLQGLEPNAMQAAMLSTASSLEPSGLIILEAPMGSGKTEAAFMAAEALVTKFGNGGIFIGLPTMATANPMLTRTRSWLDAVPSEQDPSISLAHGKAALNTEFTGLMDHAPMASIGDDLGPRQQRESRATVHQWTMGRKKTMLAQHVVGTIDQALFAGLKARHVVLRHLGLASKVVIIDECHAADHFMRVYLKRVLSWLAAYRVPVILMSATLPAAQRQEFVSAYLSGLGRSAEIPDSGIAYPRITVVSDGVEEVTPRLETPEHQVEMSLLDEDKPVADTLAQALADGGCAAVIRNTVASAQETYLQLKEQFGPGEVVLLHSRFLAPHRLQRERSLVARLGRTGERPKRLIVVGTQVLEQSLDVDFDLMITDIAPMDLLMQRIGRLHRHAGPRTAGGIESARCLITDVSTTEAIPEFGSGSKAIYGEAALLRTMAVLFGPEHSSATLTLPQDIARTVEAAYADDFQVPEGWLERFRAAELKAHHEVKESIRKAEAFVLGEPGRMSDMVGMLAQSSSEPEDAKGYARVRDGEDSLEVIVLHKDEYETVRLPDGIGEFSGRVIPNQLGQGPADMELAREMASCTVPLPHSLSGTWIVDQVIEELEMSHDVSGWQESPWLRGQLCLFLDDEGAADLSVSGVAYGEDVGLVVDKARSQEQ